MGFPEQPHDQAQPIGGQPAAGQPGPTYAAQGQPGVSQPPGGGFPSGYQARPPAGTGRTNGLAIAAMVCGLAQFLLWFFLLVPGFIAAILALIFGLVGLAQTKLRGEGGKGMAVAGIVLGSLGVLSGIVWGILLGIGSTHFHYHTGA